MKVKLPEPISGGLLLFYKCNAECRHCMYACSPKWKDWISEKDLKKILSQLAGKIKPSTYGVRRVSLNYGLHYFELLLKAVEVAHELGIPSTFVETNCYWCINDRVTRNKLEMLREKGLKGILISVNPFYLEYVPFERTERGIRISQEVFGENVMIYQLEYYFQFKKLNIKKRIQLGDYLRLVKEEVLAKNVELFFDGKGSLQVEGPLSQISTRLLFWRTL